MKISRTRSKKPLIITAAVVGALLVAGGASVYCLKLGPFANHINMSQPSANEKKAGTQIKTQTAEEATSGNKTAVGSDPAPSPSPVAGSAQSSVNMEITAANEDSGTLYIRTLIEAVANTGTCTLSMTGPGGKTHTETATIQALPSTSTCQGFNVPVSQLTPGFWSIAVKFENDSLVANATKDVTIN